MSLPTLKGMWGRGGWHGALEEPVVFVAERVALWQTRGGGGGLWSS